MVTTQKGGPNQNEPFPTVEALRFGPRPALIVVDVCDAYLTPTSPLYVPHRFDAALAGVEKVIEIFRTTNHPIIFTKISLSAPAMGGRWFAEKLPNIIPCFEEGSPLGDYPAQSEIARFRKGRSDREFEIVKQFSSCFFGTPLSSMLVGLLVETVVIVGFSTSGCIRATAVDAIQYGFRPFVVRDACGDRDDSRHESNLYDIGAKFGEVISRYQLEKNMEDVAKRSNIRGSQEQ